MPTSHLPLRQLRRVRWAVRGTLVLGVAASVAANVLHARPDPVAQLIAAWPPLALLLTVELISRVPVHRRVLAAARLIATTAIAGIAAWVSYVHMTGVASRYGEQGASPFLLPLSVDGLVVVASVSLVELAGRIRAADTASTTPVAVPARPGADQPSTAAPVAGSVRAPLPAHTGSGGGGVRAAMSAGAGPGSGTWVPEDGGLVGPAWPASTRGAGEPAGTVVPGHSTGPVGQVGPGKARDMPVDGVPNMSPPDGPPAEPRAAIAYWHAKDPTLTPKDIAPLVDRSTSTVRRVIAKLEANGRASTPRPPASAGPDDEGSTKVTVGVNGATTTLADAHLTR